MITFDVSCYDYPEGCQLTSSCLFDFEGESSWINDGVVRQMIMDIDKSYAIRYNLVISPVLGTITAKQLSGGVKALIGILKSPNTVYVSSSFFGENCLNWISRLSYMRDFKMTLIYSLFPYDDTPICAHTRDGRPLKTFREVADYHDEELDKILNSAEASTH